MRSLHNTITMVASTDCLTVVSDGMDPPLLGCRRSSSIASSPSSSWSPDSGDRSSWSVGVELPGAAGDKVS